VRLSILKLPSKLTDFAIGHRYNIYPQPHLPSADLYEHMLNWLDFYELLLDRPLQPEDYLFPSISVKGTIEPHRPITSDMAQKIISNAATSAGLPNAALFTTHCFRRGGAQYRFMFAPIGEHWTLARIQWWGGWADGEHVCIHNFSHGLTLTFRISA